MSISIVQGMLRINARHFVTIPAKKYETKICVRDKTDYNNGFSLKIIIQIHRLIQQEINHTYRRKPTKRYAYVSIQGTCFNFSSYAHLSRNHLS